MALFPTGLDKYETSDDPASDVGLWVAGIPSGTCAGVPERRRRELLALCREGLRQLQAIRDWESGLPTAGIESEIHTVRGGRPAPFALELCSAPGAREMGIVRESGRHVLEYNSSIRPLGGCFLRDYDQELRRQVAFTLSHPRAREDAVCLCPAGTLPSFLADDITLGSVTPSPRYMQLHQTVTHLCEEIGRHLSIEARGMAGTTAITLDNSRLVITSGSHSRFQVSCGENSLLPFALKAAMISMQFHWSAPTPAHYVAAHRTADLIAAVMVAVAANSPLFAGHPTGLQATRLALWPAGSHPQRVGLGSGWLATPLQQFEESVREEPAFRPLLDPSSGGKSEHRDLTPIDALLEHGKSFWPYNRTTISTEGTRGSLRVEHRPVCMAPTLTDGIANAALFYGLMEGLPARLERVHGLPLGGSVEALESRLPFRFVRQNLYNAMTYGLDAAITWVDGREYRARDLFEERLVEAARAGLEALAVPGEDSERYLGVIRRRLAYALPGKSAGTTPADVQLYLYAALQRRAGERGLSLNIEEKTIALVKLLCRAMRADTEERPCDVLEWLPGSRASLNDLLDAALRPTT